jgi:hypothetical protein
MLDPVTNKEDHVNADDFLKMVKKDSNLVERVLLLSPEKRTPLVFCTSKTYRPHFRRQQGYGLKGHTALIVEDQLLDQIRNIGIVMINLGIQLSTNRNNWIPGTMRLSNWEKDHKQHIELGAYSGHQVVGHLKTLASLFNDKALSRDNVFVRYGKSVIPYKDFVTTRRTISKNNASVLDVYRNVSTKQEGITDNARQIGIPRLFRFVASKTMLSVPEPSKRVRSTSAFPSDAGSNIKGCFMELTFPTEDMNGEQAFQILEPALRARFDDSCEHTKGDLVGVYVVANPLVNLDTEGQNRSEHKLGFMGLEILSMRDQIALPDLD